ncbi:MAG: hypothetical protein FJZ47_14235 [Candidatus Tectomicrobia bacterium]|uniref:Orc1-like AAA ATPase domain-containing protein n=1 Tax=Tectimicrobiota bacterium TaxID=2528274 RepID=A0A937W394_UNCTE|nr:hypothetical protein [Candidatus Tectomicrobia bacterium]
MPVDIDIQATNTDPQLFVDRLDETKELKLLLGRLLKSKNGQGGVLVKGDSGVGKSILSRRVLDELRTEWSADLVVVEIDGGRLTGVRGLLNRLCEVIYAEVEGLGEEDLTNRAAWLAKVASYGKLTANEIKQINQEVSASSKIRSSFWGLLSGEGALGWKRTASTSASDGYEIVITEDYLSKLLSAFLQELHTYQYRPLIFLDNLDRIGRMDAQEDANTIAALVKQLLELPDCVLLLNLRTQFAHHTTDRRELTHLALEGLPPQVLQEILAQRLQQLVSDDITRLSLPEAALHTVAERLARRTDNPLAFLRWLDFWLARTENRPEDLERDMEKFIRQYFTTVSRPWLASTITQLVAERDAGYNDSPLTPALQRPQILLLERAGAIVPDSLLLDPPERRYHLHHDLDFLLPEGYYHAATLPPTSAKG